MRIAIFGAGSLGTVLGAFMAKNGIPVDLFNRNVSHVQGLREHGARIRGTIELTVPVNAWLPEEMTGFYDVIFLMTKQADNEKTIRFILPHLEKDGVICTMQNGLPEPLIADIIGEQRTFGCSIAWGATMIGNGICELTSRPESLSFGLGSFSPLADTEKLKAIAGILGCMGEVVVEKNFMGARWAKLLVNASFSGMSAVLGSNFGDVARDRVSRRCIQLIIKECIEVAKKAKIRIEPIQGTDISRLLDYKGRCKQGISFALIPLVIRKHALLKASMLQDLEKGKLTEVDSINGMVSCFGEKFGVATPMNDLVCKTIKDMENGRYHPDKANIALFSRSGV